MLIKYRGHMEVYLWGVFECLNAKEEFVAAFIYGKETWHVLVGLPGNRSEDTLTHTSYVSFRQ